MLLKKKSQKRFEFNKISSSLMMQKNKIRKKREQDFIKKKMETKPTTIHKMKDQQNFPATGS